MTELQISDRTSINVDVSYVKCESLFIWMQKAILNNKAEFISHGHSDPQIRKDQVSKKTFLAPFGLKIGGKSDPG